jgi:hypothetical protein
MMLESEVGVEVEAVASPDHSSSIITKAKKNSRFAFSSCSTVYKLNLRRLVHNYCVYLSTMQTVTENKKLPKR